MSSLKKWTLRLISWAVVAAISIFLTLVWDALHQTYKPVPLTEGLHGTWQVVSDELDRRVKSSFSIGSSEEKMADELRHQGFIRQDWTSSVDQEHEAVRREDNFVCNQAAYVYWRSDAAGHLTSIRGSYREEGCL